MSKRERIPEVAAVVVDEVPSTALYVDSVTVGDEVLVDVPADPVGEALVDLAAGAIDAALRQFSGR